MEWSKLLKSYPALIIMHIALQFLSWYVHPLLSLISFIPYFTVLFKPQQKLYFLRLFFLNMCWNVVVTYWLCEIDWIKGPSAIIINSFLFLIPVFIWHLLKRIFRFQQHSHLLLLLLWLLFEYGHHVWDFSWTWLTIGNVFGKAPGYILWYRYTGVLGGSAWILTCNYLFFPLISYNRFQATIFLKPILLPAIPLLLSFTISIYLQQKKKITPEQFLVISTDIKNDSINDKLKLSRIETAFLQSPPFGETTVTVLPETTLAENVWFGTYHAGSSLYNMKQRLLKWHTKNIITGALLKVANKGGNFITDNLFIRQRYNEYNAALLLNSSEEIDVKLKKAYIPIAEYIPPYLSSIFGESKSYSKEAGNRNQFNINGNSYFVCICYEATNSLFVAQNLTGEDKALIMLSSESFFGSSETGRNQYKNITRLRAIENGLSLIKSTNEGTTFLCSETGALTHYSRVSETSLFKADVPLSAPSYYHAIAAFLPAIFLSGIAFIIAVNIYQQSGKRKTVFPPLTPASS